MDERKIKTREITRDIKLLDKSKILVDHIKKNDIRVKDDTISNHKAGREDSSPGSFADEKVVNTAKAIATASKETGKRKLVNSIKKKRTHTKLDKESEIRKSTENDKSNPLAVKRKIERDNASRINSSSNTTKGKNRFVANKKAEMTRKNQISSFAKSKTKTAYKKKTTLAKEGASKSIKSIIKAARSLVTAITGGGILAVVVIIIVCFIGFLVASPMGIFFSNDVKDNKMSEVISKLDIEFFEKIDKIKTKNKHDDYILTSTDGSNSINWDEVLAVYAVSTASDPYIAVEVVSTDDVKERKLRAILYDMNKIDYKVSSEKEVEKGKEYTVKVLTVTIKKKTPAQMIKKYGFNEEQTAMLTEILKPNYSDLWASLIYGSGGSGEIIGGVGSGQLAWPVPGYAANTSSYGMRAHPITGKRKMHNGTDLAAPSGTKIVAAEAGKVTSAGWNSGGYGNFTIIDHGGDLVTRYAHQSKIIAKSGTKVKRGQVIGLVGSTGASTGPHLHFEVLINGKFDDPMKYIKNK